MHNRFFFLTTYDSISGTLLSSIINTHPEINCEVSYPDPFITNNIYKDFDLVDTQIDKLMEVHYRPDKLFSGNAQQFSAFELQHKSLMERTASPFFSANILMSPFTRISFLLHGWLRTSLDAKHALTFIEQKLNQLKNQKNNLVGLYNFFYFYHLINNEISSKNFTKITIEDKLFAFALAKVIAQDSADIPAPGKKFLFEELLSSPDEFVSLLKHITENKIVITDDFYRDLTTTIDQKAKAIEDLQLPELEDWKKKLVYQFINKKLHTIYYPHITKPLSDFYAEAGYHLQAREVSHAKTAKLAYTKLLSIQLNSNRPAQLSAYFDNIEATADNPADIEVLINIDIGNHVMKSLLDREIPQRKFTIKYIETQRPPSFCDLWEPINRLLEITDPNCYFLVNISDEMLFITKGWDTILKKYVGFFPDHMFRLRASRNRFRNYFDRWEASFAQDAIPITTKKWIDIGGDWNPCFGPDSFQQLIAFYLAREGMFSNEQYLREAPFTEIKFAGDVPAIGIDRDKSWRHNNDHIKAMLICQSPRMQLEARRRAMLLKAQIIAEQHQLKNFRVDDIKSKKKLHLYDIENKQVIAKIDYRVNALAISLTNQWRKLAFFSYFGDGRTNRKNIIRSFLQYFKAKHFWVYWLDERVTNFLRPIFHINKILLNRKNYQFKELCKFHIKFKKLLAHRSIKKENQLLKDLYSRIFLENQKLHAEQSRNLPNTLTNIILTRKTHQREKIEP